jgi:ABC-type branched-subunit amino acid transport system ATPase component
MSEASLPRDKWSLKLSRSASPSEDPRTLSCVGVSKHFGGVRAVQEVSLEFHPGVITGVIGANGAGKSTLVDLLTGVQECNGGSVLLNGANITRLSAARRVDLGIGRTFQNMRLFGGMTAEENVMACLPRLRRVGLIGGLLQRRGALVVELREEAHAVLATVGAEDTAYVSVDDLSYGNQKLVAIARAVACGARVLLLDEPFAGLDEDSVIRLSGIIRNLTATGRTVGIIDHNVDAMVNLVDTMYVMNFGEIIASGLPDDVMSNPTVRSAYLGSE